MIPHTRYLHAAAKQALTLCLCVLLAFAFFTSAFAEQITSIDLGVDELTLKNGETYTFNVKYEPEVPQFYTINFFVTDDSVIEIDAPNFTVKALQAGEADILAESFDGVSFDVCHITVTGSQTKDGSSSVSAVSDISKISLSEEDSAKISSRSINRFLDFLENSAVSGPAYSKAMERIFIVSASVNPGSEKSESERAYALGMTEAIPLEYLHVITLQGTLEQILRFAENNEDLIEIFELAPIFINDTETESCKDCGKETTMLNGHVEDLTNVRIAHKAGFDGACSNIAVIDTGLNSNHDQFKGRVINEACFGRPSQTSPDGSEIINNVCVSDNSAEPGNALIPSNFNHGSHVAGIAAGKNGIAPKAGIIAIQAFTEIKWACSGEDLKKAACPGSSSMCCSQTLYGPDELQAYNHLLKLADSGIEITAVNMSYGNSQENPCPCDLLPENKMEYCMFKFMEEENIIPVSSSGNDSYDCGIGSPACLSNVLAVGALADAENPLLASYSNHNELVDITAPGTDIFSAAYETIDPKTFQVICKAGDNCYTVMGGTSMAAPMVTGALALLRQAYPDMSAAGLKSILVGMSTKFVSQRENGIPVVPKPVLNFTSFAYLRPARCFICPGMMPELPRTGFSGPESALRSKPQSINYSNTGLTIQIPALSVETDIVTVPFADNEYPVDWLNDSVGMLEGSAKPGQGVIVLTGHNHINDKLVGPFVSLGSLNKGDKIMLQNEKGELFTYTVFSNERIGKDDLEAFTTLANRSGNSITLLTCEEEQMEGGYAYRRVISASYDKLKK